MNLDQVKQVKAFLFYVWWATLFAAFFLLACGFGFVARVVWLGRK
jgi:hypothetical protein